MTIKQSKTIKKTAAKKGKKQARKQARRKTGEYATTSFYHIWRHRENGKPIFLSIISVVGKAPPTEKRIIDAVGDMIQHGDYVFCVTADDVAGPPILHAVRAAFYYLTPPPLNG